MVEISRGTEEEGMLGREARDSFLEAAGHLSEPEAAGLAGLFPAVDTAAVAAYDATLPKGLF